MTLGIACAGIVIAVAVWLIIIIGWLPQWLHPHNNAVLASTAILSLLVEIGASIVALRHLVGANRGSARLLQFSAIGIAVIYFGFFGMLLL